MVPQCPLNLLKWHLLMDYWSWKVWRAHWFVIFYHTRTQRLGWCRQEFLISSVNLFFKSMDQNKPFFVAFATVLASEKLLRYEKIITLAYHINLSQKKFGGQLSFIIYIFRGKGTDRDRGGTFNWRVSFTAIFFKKFIGSKKLSYLKKMFGGPLNEE